MYDDDFYEEPSFDSLIADWCKGCPDEAIGGPLACQSCPRGQPDFLQHFLAVDDTPENPNEHVCPICFRTFIDRANKNYCSKKCRKKAYRIRWKQRGKIAFEERVCEICGTPYIPRTTRQYTCSHSCSVIYLTRKYKTRKIKPTPARTSLSVVKKKSKNWKTNWLSLV